MLRYHTILGVDYILTREIFKKAAMRLYEYCEYNRLHQMAAVQYKILMHLLDKPYDDIDHVRLRPAFISIDIVEELYKEQDRYGGWGNYQSKDYSAKDKFPTSGVAISRCLYIGLTIEDRDILLCANEYLEDFLKGTAHEKFRNTNERVIPWNTASFCNLIEAIKPYIPLCDRTYGEWQYIAGRAFKSGEYSYERECIAQHEVFWTREDRFVPMQTELLLKRRDQIRPELEAAMLRHYGEHVYHHGHFWDKTPEKLPDNFVYNKTRRWFYTFNYINQFHGSALFLVDSVKWLMENQNADGLWDWGVQVKVKLSMEDLPYIRKYIDLKMEEMLAIN